MIRNSAMDSRKFGLGILLAGVFLASFSLICLLEKGSRSVTTTVQPRIRLESTHVSLGRLFAGEDSPSPAVFQIRNEGTGMLVIQRVIGLCGCESFELTESAIPPGEQATLNVRVRPSASGPLSAAVVLLSNDPLQPTTRITTDWEILNLIACQPPSLTLQPNKQSFTMSATADIVTYRPEQLGLLRSATVECWPNGVAANFESISNESSTRPSKEDPAAILLGSLNVTVDEESAGNRGTGWVRIRFDDRADELSIPVLWNRFPTLKANPPLLALGMVEPGIEVRRSVKIVNRNGDDFTIASVAASNKTIQVLAHGLDLSKSEHELELVIRTPNAAGVIRESVSVRANLENSVPVVVLCSGVVRAR